MMQNKRELTLLQFVSQLSVRGEWCGEPYLQSLSYLWDPTPDNGCNFEHYRFRGGPYSSNVGENLATLRAEGYITFEPVIPPAGPAFCCTAVGESLLQSQDDSQIKYLAEVFLSRPENQRLLLARAAYALSKAEKPLAWLEELGADASEGAEALSVAKELLESRCRPPVPA